MTFARPVALPPCAATLSSVPGKLFSPLRVAGSGEQDADAAGGDDGEAQPIPRLHILNMQEKELRQHGHRAGKGHAQQGAEGDAQLGEGAAAQGQIGKADDPGEPGKPLTAKFGANLFGLTLDKDGNIYLADDSFKVIKLIARGEKGYEDAVISTVAGTSGQSGKVDGKGAEARFNSPGEIRMDPSGKRLIVTEYNAFLIREIVIE